MVTSVICVCIGLGRWLLLACQHGGCRDPKQWLTGSRSRGRVGTRALVFQHDLLSKGLIERIKAATSSLAPTAGFLLAFRARLLFQVANSGPLFEKDDLPTDGPLQTLAADFLAVSVILLAALPSLIQPRVIFLWLSMWHIVMLLEASLTGSDALTDVLMEMLMLRLGFSLLHGESYMLALLSVLVSGSNIMIGIATISDRSSLEELCWREGCFGCIIMPALITAVCRAHRDHSWSLALERLRETDENVALKVLLSSLCDAVVQVDDSCTVVAPSPKLCGLLSKTDTGTSFLKGTSLFDVMPQREQERFSTYIKSTHCHQLHKEEDVGPALAFQVLFNDAMGRPIPLQVMDCCFSDASCERMHLLGLIELANQRRSSHVHSSSSMSMGTSVFTGESVMSSGGSAWMANRDWQVDFEGYHPFRITFAGNGFLREHGPEVLGACFADLLVEREAVLSWLAQQKNLVDESGEPKLLEYGQVTLKRSLEMEMTHVTRVRVLSCYFMSPADAGLDGYRISARFMRKAQHGVPGATMGQSLVGSVGLMSASSQTSQNFQPIVAVGSQSPRGIVSQQLPPTASQGDAGFNSLLAL